MIKSKPYYAIKSLMPPILLITPIENKRFAVSGSKWIPIGPEVTQKMIAAAWEPLYPRKVPDRNFKVRSEGSDNVYLVTKFSDGLVMCSCPGFSYRKHCKHADFILKNY